MKKQFTLFTAILVGLSLVLSSCSNQIYSYRSTVKVKHETAASQKPAATPIQLSSKNLVAAEVPASIETLTQGLGQTNPILTKKQVARAHKKAIKIAQVIDKMVPATTGLAALKSNIAKKDIANANDVKDAATNIDAKKWMIVGLIIMLGAIVLGLLTGYSYFYGLGALIFVIGLVFYLMQELL